MSDSDDTDVLLLIPPDFFVVGSSDSDLSHTVDNLSDPSIVDALISQVNQLEDRISLIENKDTSSQSMHQSVSSVNMSRSQGVSKNHSYGNSGYSSLRALTRSDSNLNLSPSRKLTRFNSLPPTPSSHSSRSTNLSTSQSDGRNQYLLQDKETHTDITSKRAPKFMSKSHYSPGRNSEDFQLEKRKGNNMIAEVDMFLNNLKRYNNGRGGFDTQKEQLISEALPPSPQKYNSQSAGIAQLQLDEVDRLLREVEAEQRHIEAKLNSHDSPEVRKIVNKPGENISSVPDLSLGVRTHMADVDYTLQKDQYVPPASENVITARKIKKPGEEIESVPDLGFGIREAWSRNDLNEKPNSTPTYQFVNDALDMGLPSELKNKIILESDLSHENASLRKQNPKVFHSRRKLDLNTTPSLSKTRTGQCENGDHGLSSSFDSCLSDTDAGGQTTRDRTKRNTESLLSGKDVKNIDERSSDSVSRPLLSLADLWSDGEVQDLVNAGHSKLLHKYEEECFRRQHCEQLLQAYQKKLLECQQKLAVALRVDSDKDAAIAKLQDAWRNLVDHWRVLEDQRHMLAQQLQDQKSKSDTQVKQMQQKVEQYEVELCKALDLAHGYKERSESAEQIHQNQLEQLSSKVKELERRHASVLQARTESQTREEVLRRQLDQSHKKLLELQAHMEEVTKSLTTHEADATVLAEEKIALQTRLKEERSRTDILQQSKNKIKVELEESLKREHHLESELKKSLDQLESIKTELHDFYQAQLERVVCDKLKEFQAQLDTAESALQKELESRERSVAQLATCQLQHVMEKHKLEISLLEEKHSEELRLMHLQLVESSRKIRELQACLAAYNKRSSTIAERLHGVMENQWKEALNILNSSNDKLISASEVDALKPRGNVDIGRNDTERAWVLVQQQQHQHQTQSECSAQSSAGDDVPFSQDGQITRRTASPVQPQHETNDAGEDLRKYIKMLLERSPGNPFDVATPPMRVNNTSMKGSLPQSISQNKPPWK